MVSDPLYNARIHFIREFVALAPSRQRKDYIDIELNRFGLREHVPEDELIKILE